MGGENISKITFTTSILFFLIILSILPANTNAVPLKTDLVRLKEYEKGIIKRVFVTKDKNKYSTLIQKVVNKGYKSDIAMYITINFSDERIEEFTIVSHNESDNYAKYITKGWFLKRFLKKSADRPLKLVKMSAKNPDEVVAVTGATKSSEAIIEGVNRAFRNYQLIKGGLINEKKD